MSLTTQEIFKEYVKCLSSPTYAIETYLETFDKTQEGFVPFKLFPRQKEIVSAYEKHRFNLVTKPRQAGVSTTTAAYMSIKVGFADADNPEAVLIIANKQELAFEFLAKIKDFLSQLPRWIWGDEYYGNAKNEGKSIFLTDSKKEIRLPNGSRVKAVATSKDALRGFTPTYLVMDEAAYIDNGAEVFGAALTALGCLTKDSLILTENGLVELDELVTEKDKLGFTDLETPHMVCNKDGILTPATQTFVSEYGETFKIKTKLGVELEGSWKHPLLINRNGEEVWVRMNELAVGDKPIINYGQNYFGENDYVINDNDYIYTSNELLKAKKEILIDYIGKLFSGRDYFINTNNNTLRRVQSLLFNMGIISIIDGDMLVKLTFTHDFNNIIIDEIIEITKGEDYTYDLHVPETNSFISNGIVSHNTGGKATLISTPKGMDALYYNTYDQAKKKKNNFNIIEMKWYEDLRYNKGLKWLKGDEEVTEHEFTFDSYNRMIDDGWKPTSFWYEEMCRGMNNDAKMIAQELDVSFIGSGGNVIDEEYIEYQNKFNVKDPILTLGAEDEIWIWEEPQEGHQYILGVDVSRGDGEDASTIVILDFTTMEQVMEYQGKIQPDLLAQIVEEYGEMYKAYTVVDITGGMGVSTVLKLLEFDYKRLHYDVAGGKILSSRQREIANYGKGDKIPGFQATSVRLPMIANLEYKIRTDAIKIRSVRLTSELKTFIYKNGRPDHMEGYHDDLIMSLAMCLWVVEHSFKNLERLEKQNKAMLNSWLGGSNNPNPTVKSIDPVTKQTVTKINPQHAAYKNVQDPTGQYMWLFGGNNKMR